MITIKSGVISVFIGKLPAMKITDPYSPTVLPSLATGFTLALARSVGEYGSVIFIAGNLPMKTEITPLLIVIKLEQFDYVGAAAIGLVMLCVSFLMLFTINAINGWRLRRMSGRR